MSFDTFTPAMLPSMGTGTSTKPRVISNTFGDGYRQTVKDGLNAYPITISVAWNMLQVSDAAAIEAFFIAHIGQPFLWTPPRYSSALKWEATDWTRTSVSGAQDKVTATFQQRFDLG
jgi:phage-related protein